MLNFRYGMQSVWYVIEFECLSYHRIKRVIGSVGE